MRCKHCNSEIDEDSVFCEQCGARVVDEISDDNHESIKSNKKKYIWFGVVVAVVVVIAIFVWRVLPMMHVVGAIALTLFVILGLVLWYVALFTHSKKQKRLY